MGGGESRPRVEPQEQIAELKQQIADARAEIGSLKKALDTREADNKAARDRIKAIESERDEVAAKLPAADAIILTGDDAKQMEAYQALGKPDLLQVKLDDYERATQEATALKRRELVDKAARDPKDETQYRYKPSVLQRLLTDATLTITDKGDAIVKAGETEKPLEKWLEEDQADFLPAVQTAPLGTPAARQAGDRRGTPTVTTEQLAERKRQTGEYNF